MLTITSSNPISVTKDGVTQVYDTWKLSPSSVPRLRINASTGLVSLAVGFNLWGLNPSSQPVMYPGPAQILSVSDVIGDETLGTAMTALFTAIGTKAVSSGVIS